MKETNPYEALLAFRAKYRTQTAAAEALGVSVPYFNDMLHMRRDISDNMLAKLGLRRVVVKESKSA